ncbi:MAG: trypsin-like peptidase domain-containing protein [Candidatus Riflebacteria bacterium]|nr:trypsin-like peptidase domain-containing protein [Candidatus Riflebacteria bacterium]
MWNRKFLPGFSSLFWKVLFGVIIVISIYFFALRNYKSADKSDKTSKKIAYEIKKILPLIEDSMVMVWANKAEEEEEEEEARNGPTGIPGTTNITFDILGCGLIVASDGYVLTTIAFPSNIDKRSLQVVDIRGNKYDAQIVNVDRERNLTLIRMVDNTQYSKIHIEAKFGRSEQLVEGDGVIAIGGRRTPFGWELAVKEGQILKSYQSLVVKKKKYWDLLQTDLKLAAEDSGGILVNAKGEIVGFGLPYILKGSPFEIDGVSYALPIRQCQKILAGLLVSVDKVTTLSGHKKKMKSSVAAPIHRGGPILEVLAIMIVFFMVYYLVYSDAVHRVIPFLLGATIIGIIGTYLGFYDHDKIYIILVNKIDVLLLLVGMALIAGVLELSGLFDYLAKRIAVATNGKKWKIMFFFSLMTYFVSLFINNLSTIRIVAPTLLRMSTFLLFDPKPFLISMIIASNLGGASTMIGDFPNILISAEMNIPFMQFIYFMFFICLFEQLVYLMFLRFSKSELFNDEKKNKKSSRRIFSELYDDDWKDDFPELANSSPEKKSMNSIMKQLDNEWPQAIVNKTALKRGLIILGLVSLGFIFFGNYINYSAYIAFSGGMAALLFGGCSRIELLKKMSLIDLLFFSGLFIMVGAAEASGLTMYLSELLVFISFGNVLVISLFLMWTGAFLTCFLNAGPTMALFIPIVLSLGKVAPYNLFWWALSLGICAGSSATITGATAGAVTATMFENFKKKMSGSEDYNFSSLTFMNYAKWGIPAMFLFLTLSTVYISLLYIILCRSTC